MRWVMGFGLVNCIVPTFFQSSISHCHFLQNRHMGHWTLLIKTTQKFLHHLLHHIQEQGGWLQILIATFPPQKNLTHLWSLLTSCLTEKILYRHTFHPYLMWKLLKMKINKVHMCFLRSSSELIMAEIPIWRKTIGLFRWKWCLPSKEFLILRFYRLQMNLKHIMAKNLIWKRFRSP